MLSNTTRNRFKLIVATASLTLTLVGCATGSPIPDSERDTTGTYDGIWRVDIAGPEGIQHENGTTLKCGAKKWRGLMIVKEGEGAMTLLFNTKVEFNVGGDDGSFYTAGKSKERWSSSRVLVENIKGKLSGATGAGTGYYVIGREPFYGAGCRYKSTFKRIRK